MFFSAMVLGVISPKISNKMVISMVIIPMAAAVLFKPIDWSRFNRMVVASTDAAMFAILFPMRMAVSNCLGFSKRWVSFFFFFGFFSISARSLYLLMAVKAVSALEKKADNNKKIAKKKKGISEKVFKCL